MTGKRRLVCVAALGLAALALSAGMVSAAGDTEVSVEPADENVTVNSTQTFGIVVENASDDVKGYEFNISLSNGATAEIVDVSPRRNPDAFNANISQDNTTVSVDAIWLTNNRIFQSSSPTILDIEIAGTATGQVDLNTDLASATGPYNDLAGADGSYNVTASNAASITVEQPSAEFSVSNLSAPSSAVVGDVVTATATIENTGAGSGEQTVEFRVDGTMVDSTTVNLDAGASQNVSLSANTSGLSAGTVTHGIFTEDDSQTAQLTIVQQGANVQIPGANNPATDTTGDGKLNDANGDGSFTPADVTILFNNRNSAAVQDNQVLFDFNGDGSFTPADVTTLFNRVL